MFKESKVTRLPVVHVPLNSSFFGIIVFGAPTSVTRRLYHYSMYGLLQQ